jgi:hypothetical protein
LKFNHSSENYFLAIFGASNFRFMPNIIGGRTPAVASPAAAPAWRDVGGERTCFRFGAAVALTARGAAYMEGLEFYDQVTQILVMFRRVARRPYSRALEFLVRVAKNCAQMADGREPMAEVKPSLALLKTKGFKLSQSRANHTSRSGRYHLL